MTQTTMTTVPTVRLVERNCQYRAFCNDCPWHSNWMDEAARDIKAGRHLNLHRVARGLERIEVGEPAWR